MMEDWVGWVDFPRPLVLLSLRYHLFRPAPGLGGDTNTYAAVLYAG
jgi:hypothetical protein